MTPKHRNKRLALVAIFGFILTLGLVLVFSALKRNTQFFYNPSEILAEDFESQSEVIRIGGLVLVDSVEKGAGTLTRFAIADFVEGTTPTVTDVPYIRVEYNKVLPDLFREGQGVVVTGRLVGATELIADNVLAKHDENYQPKKVVEAVEK